MSRQGNVTTLQQRLEIHARSEAGETDPQIAAAMGLSYWVVRKWRRCQAHEGRVSLAVPPGRPATGALGSVALALREAIQALRQAHPGWGPQTILTELEHLPAWAEHSLPSRARIAAYLHELALTRPYAHHTELEQPALSAPTASHEVWELDAQGVVQVAGLGNVSVINIWDPLSRVRVESYPCVHKRKPATADYQLACRRAFLTFGLPQRLSLDHDSVFYDNTCASPFPSRFHVWLLGLGIQVSFIHLPPPAAHAGIERMHQVVYQQGLAGQTFADAASCWQALDARRDFLNQQYPTRQGPGQPPLLAHPSAHHSGRVYDPYQEVAGWDTQAVAAYLARQRWFRAVSTQGQFSLGAQVYTLGQAWAAQSLEVTFEADTQQFICQSADGQRTVRVAARGLTATDVCGELPPWQELPAYQHRLPFSSETWREELLYQALPGTIL
ncbi:MAG TPA: helix-turn-helix domain-containing protein [Chloroflexi bacterium]|nr:helix-turn-helix domain-containing protein [Chloroflexota bacterium]